MVVGFHPRTTCMLFNGEMQGPKPMSNTKVRIFTSFKGSNTLCFHVFLLETSLWQTYVHAWFSNRDACDEHQVKELDDQGTLLIVHVNDFIHKNI